MATENNFPTIRDMRDKLNSLVAARYTARERKRIETP